MMRLTEIAPHIEAEVLGRDVVFDSVSVDSRSIKPGGLYVAIKGERFDGHQFVVPSFNHGAVAALVSSPISENGLLVKDTKQALGKMAAYWRAQFQLPVIAITGSNGKTTVKEMVASILGFASGGESVLATMGNFNNDIGMPLTLMRMHSSHQYAVIEMGMNHMHEISYLTHIAKPTIALVNNVGVAHIGELGSMDAIAEAKAEIFEGLAIDGVAIINQDDAYAGYFKNLHASRQMLTYGIQQPADVTARYHATEDGFLLAVTTSAQSFDVRLSLAGTHNAMNALAAIAISLTLNIPVVEIQRGLATFKSVHGRLEVKQGIQGIRLIDDAYNANPNSMKAAIEVLALEPGQKIFVMGDMAELGAHAIAMHQEIGLYAKEHQIDYLYGIGPTTFEACQSFGVNATHFEDMDQLVRTILAHGSSVTVLIKGSRFMQMERVVDQLTMKQHERTY